MAKYLELNDIGAYKRAYKLSNYVWNIVLGWDWFSKKTVGSQYTRAVDSISAIIAEGFGRHFKKDKIHFYRMAKGSVTESLDWTQKSKVRKLLADKEYEHVLSELKELSREINSLIKYTNSKLRE